MPPQQKNSSSFVVGAITVIIPILHRIGKMNAKGGGMPLPLEQRNHAAIDEEIAQLEARIWELKRSRSM